jgi:hypothetical protein
VVNANADPAGIGREIRLSIRSGLGVAETLSRPGRIITGFTQFEYGIGNHAPIDRARGRLRIKLAYQQSSSLRQSHFLWALSRGRMGFSRNAELESGG